MPFLFHLSSLFRVYFPACSITVVHTKPPLRTPGFPQFRCGFLGPVLLTLLLQHGIILGIIGEETPDVLLHNERGPAAREGKAQWNQPPYSDSTTSASKK